VLSFSVRVVPEVLQTRDYAEAAYRACRPEVADEDLGRLVDLQLRRQQLLLSGGRRLRVLVDESVLLRSVGSESVMAGQVEYLTSVAGHPAVTLQVVGLAAARPWIGPSFTILKFRAMM
jgi:hypothetical protein